MNRKKDNRQMKDLVLLPRPRQMKSMPGQLLISTLSKIVLGDSSAAMRRAGERLSRAGKEFAGAEWAVKAGMGRASGKGAVTLSLDTRQVKQAQGYHLCVGATGINVKAADEAGLLYGVMTVVQLLRQSHCVIPALEIRDYPDFPVRGVMLDISRDKVPTLATLQALIERLAEWKINHLELYTEHTFAYSRHKEVWKHASPMTAAEIRKLDVFCRERCVDLVPNQNSFGHMSRWLTLPAYRDLAECPNGHDTPWGFHDPKPNSLNPEDPRSLELMKELYAELLPNFSSTKFNVGCDETWDLGQGKCKEVCEARGKGRVYLDFLIKIAELVKQHGRTMHFWGDIIIKHPELVESIPPGVVVLEWGYDADHPFDEHGAKFAASGIPFYVCPGTSAWNSLAGRTDNCLENLRSAAANGLKHGAIGFLNTDWGDGGHWQYLPASYLGFAAGAALSWNLKANVGQDWPRVMDVHVFEDEAGVMGGLAFDLGNAYQKTGRVLSNGSVMNTLLQKTYEWVLSETVTEATLGMTKGWIDGVMNRLQRAAMKRPDAALIMDEFRNAARLMHHACDRGILTRRGQMTKPEERARLASDLKSIAAEHRRLWLARNRPGGLAESVGRLEERIQEYEA